jgi:hypothetical protein
VSWEITDRAADQFAAHGRDDAEAAAVVAAFGNLQVRVMTRGQLDPLRRHQIDQRVVIELRRGGVVDGIDHLLVLLRTGDGQHARMDIADHAFVHAHAAGDDHFAVLGQRLANGLEGFSLGAVDETAGVDHDHVSVLVGRNDLIAFHAQLGQDAFGIDQGLRATEADKADLGGGRRGDGGH